MRSVLGQGGGAENFGYYTSMLCVVCAHAISTTQLPERCVNMSSTIPHAKRWTQNLFVEHGGPNVGEFKRTASQLSIW